MRAARLPRADTPGQMGPFRLPAKGEGLAATAKQVGTVKAGTSKFRGKQRAPFTVAVCRSPWAAATPPALR